MSKKDSCRRTFKQCLVMGWGWLLGAVIPAVLAAFWAWRVSGKATTVFPFK